MPSSLPYFIDGRGELAWDIPDTNPSGTVHSICGYGHTVDASYMSDSGSDIMRVVIRLNGAPLDAVQVGQAFPDQDGGPYVIVEKWEHCIDEFEAVVVTAAREDVYLKAMECLASVKAGMPPRKAGIRVDAEPTGFPSYAFSSAGPRKAGIRADAEPHADQ